MWFDGPCVRRSESGGEPSKPSSCDGSCSPLFPRGPSILAAMKEQKALDKSGDGLIDAKEFKRLYNPTVRENSGACSAKLNL